MEKREKQRHKVTEKEKDDYVTCNLRHPVICYL